jgi:hypothetical protein
MKIIRKAGDTSNILQIFIQDSSSTVGAGLTGLTNATSGLTAYYHKDTDTTATAMSLVTMTVGTFTSLGFKEIDSTNMPGWYQLCPPDAALSTSGTPKSVGIHLKGATNMAPLAIEIQLVSIDVQDTVRAGLTALPNVASGSAGAIPTTGTGSNQISVSSGLVALQAAQKVDVDTIKTNPVVNAGTVTFPTNATLASTTNITSITGNITGNLSGSVGSVTTAITLPSIPANWITAAGINAAALNGKGDWLLSSSYTVPPTTAQIATGVWTTTTASDFTTALSVGKSVMNGVALGTGLTVANLTNAPTAGDLTATMKTSVTTAATAATPTAAAVTAAVSVTGDLSATMKTSVTTAATAATPTAAAVTAGVTVTTNNDKTGYSLTQAFPANFSALSIDGGGNAATTSNVKKNAAQSAFAFVMTDATTHAPKTSLAVTATRSIDGAAFGACANAVVEVSGGWYTIALAAADVNGNDIALRFTAAGADDCDMKFKTQP